MKLELSQKIFEKLPSINFYKNPSRGSLAVPCGRIDRARERERDTENRSE
jgi:hypothetical protein